MDALATDPDVTAAKRGRVPILTAFKAIAPLVLALSAAASLRIHNIALHPPQLDEPLSLELTRGYGSQHERRPTGVPRRRDQARDVLSQKAAGRSPTCGGPSTRIRSRPTTAPRQRDTRGGPPPRSTAQGRPAPSSPPRLS